ncbi:MAG: hypothetical protein K8J31_02650 [Anaerolineae bacterium]|nr:hypothetical protein [Anaerolineae bacterium]
MRRKRKFRTRRHIDEPTHPITRTPSADIQLQTALRTGHLTPDAIMTLQRTVGNQAVIQRLGDDEPGTGAAAQTDAEKRLQAIIASLNPKKKDDKGDAEQYKKALEASLKALMETDTGKDLKKRVIDLATSKQGIPFTVLVGSGALAALFATNAGIPSIPDIPVGEGMSISIDLDGTMQQPTGIKFTFKYKFGGSKDKEKSKATDVTELPETLQEVLKVIDKRLIREWMLARAYHEYETAGPDEETAEKKTFDELNADKDGLPDTHLVIEALARQLIEQAGDKRIIFDMQYAEVWDTFQELSGLLDILKGIIALVIPVLPGPAQEVEQITFKCGRKVIPIPVKRPEAKPEE